MTGDRETAEDITSEAFLALYRNLDSIDESLLPGWLLTVARNRARDLWRRRVVEQRGLEQLADPPSVAQPAPLEAWMLECADLKPVHRTCLMLRYVYGMTRAEIADKTGLSETPGQRASAVWFEAVARGVRRAHKMKAPADGWDDEERDAIDELRDELETLQTRHRDDPEIALLRAARHAVLPPDVQQAADDRLLNDAWSRTLVDGLDAVEPSLDKHAEDQLLARIRRDAQSAQKDHQKAHEPDRRRWTWLRPALASAALVAVAAAAWIAFRGPTLAPGDRPIPREQPPAETSSAAVTTPPVWQVPLDKPDVTLSLAALTWRGAAAIAVVAAATISCSPTSRNRSMHFRNNDYARADRAFAALESRYPNAVEVFFYGGVSRLFVNDPQRAIAALTRAADLADTTFAPRTAWYLAIAEERAGHLSRARARLDELCRGTSDRAAPACAAVTRIDASSAPPAR